MAALLPDAADFVAQSNLIPTLLFIYRQAKLPFHTKPQQAYSMTVTSHRIA